MGRIFVIENSSTQNVYNMGVRVGYEVWKTNEQVKFYGTILGDNGSKIVVTAPYGSNITQFSLCYIGGYFLTPKNSDEFDYRKYLETKKVGVILNAKKIICRNDLLISQFFVFREKIIEKINKSIPQPESGLLVGIIFGEKVPFSTRFEENIRSSGLSHVVAASGYNVSIVASTVEFSLSKLNSRIRKVFTIILIWIYALLTGFAPSMLRATLMTTLVIMSSLFKTKIEGKSIFLISASLMILISPLITFDLGFQLSVAATFGLMYLSPKLEEIFIKKWIPYSTISCILATLPITLINFHTLNIYTLLGNMLVLPFLDLLLVLGVIGVVIRPILYLCFGVLEYMVFVVGIIGKLPFATLEISPELSKIIAISIFSLIFVILYGKKLYKYIYRNTVSIN